MHSLQIPSTTRFVIGTFAVLSLLLASVFPVMAQARGQVTGTPTYSAAVVNTSVSGTTATLVSRASIQNYGGRENELFIKFIWGDGTQEIIPAMTLAGYYKSSRTVSISGFTVSHTYAVDASYPITMKFYRGSSTGAETYPKESVSFSLRTENSDSVCRNGVDDDRDYLTDKSDSDCARFMVVENTLPLCTDGIDNDLNGKKDFYDPSCKPFLPPEDTLELCSDGLDNDYDGRVDLDDENCGPFGGPTEDTLELCRDGIDNDYDGKIDGRDSSCFPFNEPEDDEITCTDGIDNDYNGFMDRQEGACTPFFMGGWQVFF